MAAYLHELSVSSQRVDTSIGQLMERTNESFMSRRIAAGMLSLLSVVE